MLAEGGQHRLRTCLTRCTFSYSPSLAGRTAPQKIRLRISEKSNGASWLGDSIGPGACTWLAASARPVAGCATIAGRLVPVGLDARRGAHPGVCLMSSPVSPDGPHRALLRGSASHEAEGRRGARAGRMRAPAGRPRLLRQILNELVPGLEQRLMVPVAALARQVSKEASTSP